MKKKDVGLGAKAPKDTCENEKCPWHGHLKIRGRIFKGRVVSSKVTNTAIVQWNYYNYNSKYERYERRKTRIACHNPLCIAAQTGDMVRIGECRPISKSKSFVIFEKISEKK
ncbi:30S ribosomal protein S17 [archaeon]|nr:30S ribosomal protein S17 [archaeon]